MFCDLQNFTAHYDITSALDEWLLEKHIVNPLEFAFGGIMVVFDLERRILPMTVPAKGE